MGRLGPPRFADAITATGLYALAAVLLLGMTTRGMEDDRGVLAIAGLVVCVGALVLGYTRRLDLGVILVFLYIGVADGYLKLRTNSDAATVARDVVLYALAGGALVRLAVDRRPLTLPPFTGHLLLVVASLAVAALNPDTPGVRGILAGFKQHLEFVPLFFLGFAVVRSERPLEVMVAALIGITALNAIVAVVQANLSPDQLAGWGPGYAERINGTGAFAGASRVFETVGGETRVRPFGLGSDFGTSGQWGWVTLGPALGLLSSARRREVKGLGVFGVVACVVGILASQSRSAVLFGVLAVLCFAALTTASRRVGSGLFTVALAGVVIALAVNTFAGSQSAGAFDRYATILPGNAVTTIQTDRGTALESIVTNLGDYPFGAGLGRVGPGSGFSGAASTINAESEFSLQVAEVGLLGLVLFFSFWTRIIAGAVRAARGSTSTATRGLLAGLATTLIVMLVNWFAGTPSVSAPTAAVFWLGAGAVAYFSSPAARALRGSPR